MLNDFIYQKIFNDLVYLRYQKMKVIRPEIIYLVYIIKGLKGEDCFFYALLINT